ncbi:MAG: CBS domain-containing protein [Chromatiaceae bacterium]
MQQLIENGPVRDDFVNALKELDSFVDVTVDDLMELNARANKYARLRATAGRRVDSLMSQPVTAVTPACSLAEAAHLMVTRRISGLPVVDEEERLVGVVTEADFLRAVGVPCHHPTHSLWQTLEAMFAHHAVVVEPAGTVSELMVTDVVSVGPQQTAHDVLDVMKKNRIKRVVVCDDDRHVVGMVTRSDLVRVFFDRFAATDTEPGCGERGS